MPQLPDYHLTFEHPQLAGIEVTMGRLTVDEQFDLADILALPATNRDENKAYAAALSAFIGKHMVAWNVTDRHDEPLPPGPPADSLLMRAIRDGWVEGLNGGAAPLAPAPRPAIEDDLADLMQDPQTPPPEQPPPAQPEPSDAPPGPAS